MIGYIYCFRNRTNGKCYIGKTMKSVDERWKAHLISVRRGSQTHFHNAIRRYGDDAFELEWVKHVEVFDVSSDFPDEPHIKTSLDLEEVLLIEHWDTFEGEGYNMTPGGEGGITGDGLYGASSTEHKHRCGNGLTKNSKKLHRQKIVSGWRLTSTERRARIAAANQKWWALASESQRKRRTGAKPVRRLNLNDGQIVNFVSTVEAMNSTQNSFHGSIGRCANGKLKTHAGYSWEWIQ